MPFAIIERGNISYVAAVDGDIHEISRWIGDNTPVEPGEHPLRRVSFTIESTNYGAFITDTLPRGISLSRNFAEFGDGKGSNRISIDLGLGVVILPLTADEAKSLYVQMLIPRNS
jgi:hypothetical protein